MKVFGLPAHVLVIHAAVVFTPLAVLSAWVFVGRPAWRSLTRWPTAILAVVALGSVWAARITGNSFLNTRPQLAPLMATHKSRGDTLSLIVIAFAVVTVAAAYRLGGPSLFASGGGARTGAEGAESLALSVAVVLLGLAVLIWVVLTGDAGARAAWG
ncbi:MAG: DUF2231 domain-containing protein [Nocardioidaceae bacterium]